MELALAIFFISFFVSKETKNIAFYMTKNVVLFYTVKSIITVR